MIYRKYTKEEIDSLVRGIEAMGKMPAPKKVSKEELNESIKQLEGMGNESIRTN